MATIGRNSAVAEVGVRRRHLHGVIAFVTWLDVHAALVDEHGPGLEVHRQAYTADTRDRKFEEAFIDGSLAPPKKGGAGVGKTKLGQVTKIIAAVDGTGVPVAVFVGLQHRTR